jgi:hypothetical protein
MLRILQCLNAGVVVVAEAGDEPRDRIEALLTHMGGVHLVPFDDMEETVMTLLARGPDSHRLTPQEQQRWWQFSNDLLAWNGTTVFTTHVLTLGRRLLPAQL